MNRVSLNGYIKIVWTLPVESSDGFDKSNWYSCFSWSGLSSSVEAYTYRSVFAEAVLMCITMGVRNSVVAPSSAVAPWGFWKGMVIHLASHPFSPPGIDCTTPGLKGLLFIVHSSSKQWWLIVPITRLKLEMVWCKMARFCILAYTSSSSVF